MQKVAKLGIRHVKTAGHLIRITRSGLRRFLSASSTADSFSRFAPGPWYLHLVCPCECVLTHTIL